MTFSDPCTLITGATGFIGHHLLAAMLRRGRDGGRIAVALRSPVEDSLRRLTQLLREVDVDLSAHLISGRVIPVRLDLTEADVFRADGIPVRSVIHAAAVTRFTADEDGEPHRTNVAGIRRLLDWAARHAVREFHLVSSAYACGRTARPVPEASYAARPDFHNAYEQSKWQAEQLCRGASTRGGDFTLTVYRPSIVVGDFRTGRTTKLDGFYVPVRATALLARSYDGQPRERRHAIPLRISGRSDDRQNIVPVDYVAAMIAAIHADPCRHGKTYHLVHPDPPTNAAIKLAMESHYDIGGGRFVEPADFDDLQLTDAERLFRDVSDPVTHYFTETPDFTRANAAQVEQETGITCARYDEAALHRLFRGASEATGRARRRRRHRNPGKRIPAIDSPCAVYFQRFLPARMALSRVARTTAMDVTIRFVIDADGGGGDWVCRFDAGRLSRVTRAHEHAGAVDFGYRADLDTFFKAISGRAHPQEFFFGGGADVFGDVERALKMAMILNAFSREHPCDRAMLTGNDGDDDQRRLAC